METNREGIVFGLMTAEEQEELQNAPRREYFSSDGGWSYHSSNLFIDSMAYRPTQEPPVDENRITFEGAEYEAVTSPDFSCSGCVFYGGDCSKTGHGKCSPSRRQDKRNIIWKRVEPPVQFPPGFRFVEINWNERTEGCRKNCGTYYSKIIENECFITDAMREKDFAWFGFVELGKAVIKHLSVGWLTQDGFIFSKKPALIPTEKLNARWVVFEEGGK